MTTRARTQPLAEHRRRAASTAQTFLSLPNAVILGVETTGITIEDQAVEIAVIDSNGRPALNSLVNPGHPISPSASRVNGLTQIDIEAAPTTARLEPRVRQALENSAIAAYNAPFAIGRLQHTLREAGFPNIEHSPGRPLCVMRLFAQWTGEWIPAKNGYRWHTLEQALQLSGLKQPTEPGALPHARHALAILRYLASHAQGAPRAMTEPKAVTMNMK